MAEYARKMDRYINSLSSHVGRIAGYNDSQIRLIENEMKNIESERCPEHYKASDGTLVRLFPTRFRLQRIILDLRKEIDARAASKK